MTRSTLQVLLVEDEDSMISRWNDAVDAFNADVERHGFLIDKLSAKSVQEAKDLLAVRKLDAVVVDLRLQGEAGIGEDNDDGNKLIRHIGDTQPIGIVVYTGQTVQADRASFPPQVQVMDKGAGLEPVFAWLSSQKELFLRLRGIRAAMERETAKIFFKSIWPRWKQWTKDGEGDDLTEALARHVTAHVHDALLHAAGGAAHPEETYFVPPLKDWLDTGDLLRRDSGLWIVVTPRCDLANEDKVATVLLAKCEDIAKRWNDLDGSKTGAKEQKKISQHEGSPKQHFLPLAFDGTGTQLGPLLVQFHHLEAMPLRAARECLTPPDVRIASLAPQFIPSLVERFGAYFSRIGTPNLSSE